MLCTVPYAAVLLVAAVVSVGLGVRAHATTSLVPGIPDTFVGVPAVIA